MANPAWFNFSTYMANKLTSIKAADPDGNWDAQKLSDAFSAAGFPGEEGAYAHFQQYGNSADENISPNANFIPSQYYIFKAASYYNKAVADVTDAEAASISTAIHDAGMSAWQHYIDYGTAEKINPSNNFDTAKYLEAKAAALNAAQADGKTDWTADDVAAAFKDAGMNALEHAILYSADDTPGEAAKAFNDNGSVIDAYKVDDKAADQGGDSGATFTLSAKADYADTSSAYTMDGQLLSDFKFTSSNETVTANAGTLNGDGNVNDVLIDGNTSDNDVLNATLTGMVTPTLTNIETINLTINADGAGLDMANTTGAKNVSVTGTQAGVVAMHQSEIPTLSIVNYAKTLTAQFDKLDGTTKAGTAETLNLKVEGTTKDSVLNLQDTAAAGGQASVLETMNITANGSAANILTIQSGDNSTSVEAYAVSGGADLDLRLTQAMINGKTLSAVDHKGTLTLTVDRTGIAAAATNMSNVSGVDNLVVKGANTDSLVLNNLASGSNVTVAYTTLKDGHDVLSVKGAASAKDDSLTLTIDNAKDNTDTTIGDDDLTIADVETISLVSEGASAKGGNTVGKLIATKMATLNVSGDSALNVTVDDTDTALTSVVVSGKGDHVVTLGATGLGANVTVDASKAEGKVTVDGTYANGTGTAKTFAATGGDGDDIITASTGAAVEQTLAGGLGDDTFNVEFSSVLGKVSVTGGDGKDTINIIDAGTAANLANGGVRVDDFAAGSDGDVLVFEKALGNNYAGGIKAIDTDNPTTLTKAGDLDGTKVNVFTGFELSTGITDLGDLHAAASSGNVIVAVYNATTGMAEVWADANGDFSAGAYQVATIGTITTLSGMANLVEDNFGVTA